MRRASVFTLVAGAVAIGGCSLFTTFPTIEEQDATSTSSSDGSSSASGETTSSSSTGGACVKPPDGCDNTCVDSLSYCLTAPTLQSSRPIEATAAPAQPFSPSIVLSDAILDATGQNPMFVGSFYGDGTTALDGVSGSTVIGSASGNGLIVDAGGKLFIALAACDPAMGGAPVGELLVTGVSRRADGDIGVVGAFVGPRLVSYTTTPNCGDPNHVDAFTTNLTPFMWWFNDMGFPQPSFNPTMGAQSGNAAFTDTESVSADAATAVGVSIGPAFAEQDQGAAAQYFVVTSSGASDRSVKTLKHAPCDTFSNFVLDQYDISVAVAEGASPALWVAGTTGCPGGQHGFLEVWETTSNGAMAPTIADAPLAMQDFELNTMGDLRLQAIALTADALYVAGVYKGEVDIQVDMAPVEPGDPEGSVFVARYPRDNLSNQTPPTWFRRFLTEDSAAEPYVTDLRVNGSGVFVSARFGAAFGIGDVYACATGFATRGSVTQLDPATGNVGWARLDGSFPTSPVATDRDAFTSLVLPTDAGDLFTAVSTHGDVVLECGQGATDAARPTAVIERLTLSGR